MMKNTTFDIVIVNYNSTDCTIQCIESIYRNIKLQNNIIVVDNNSEELSDSIPIQYPEVRYIKSKKNQGFAKAVNIAFKWTTSKYVLLINPDTLIIDKSFCDIFDYMEENSEISICGPMILDKDGSIQGSARRFPTIWTSIFGRKSPLTRLYPNNSITKREFICFNGEVNKAQEVDWISGACMVIRKEAFDQVGGFDKSFFLYWEDTDLCRRMTNFGWKICYFPQAKIIHAVGRSSSTRPFSSVFHFHKSSYILCKNHSKLPIELIAPLVALGLSIRCLFVMGLIGSEKFLKRKMVSPFRVKSKRNDKKRNNRKIKVLRIVSRLNIGGPAIHCSILLKGLNQKKFASKLVTGTISPFEGNMEYLIKNNGYMLKIPELQRDINFRKDFLAFIKIVRIIFTEKPDILHTHMAKAGAVSRVAAFLYNLVSLNKIRTVHTYHGNVLEGYFSRSKSKVFASIERIIARFTDAIIAISRTQRWELIYKYCIAKPDKVYTINLGLNLSPFLYSNGLEQKFRQRIGIDNSTKLIGIVGRLVPIKNHLMFLKSAKLFLEINPHANVKFIIIGDGELKTKLADFANDLKIKDKVLFHGWEKNIPEVYSDLDILALTSMNEGTPVSIIEAMASGVPVITTGVGGVKDLLGKYESDQTKSRGFIICERGILLKKDDYVSLANGIEFLLENKNTARINMARQYVIQNYSDNKLVERMEKLYDVIL